MAIWQRFAGLIWAAIFIVALQLAPTAAAAHGGHDHQRSQHHHAQQAGAKPKPVVGVHRGDETAQPVRRAAELKAPATIDEKVVAATTCPGGCCSGMGCCAAAIAATGPPLPQREAAAEIVAVQGTRPGGTRPDGLMKPPRTLA